MRAVATTFPEVLVIEPDVVSDDRGFFLETYHRQKFSALGIDCEFVQHNHSHSTRGTLRGPHYQLRCPQAKLCRVVEGEVLDVAVDVRRGSPTSGRFTSVVLSADNFRQLTFHPASPTDLSRAPLQRSFSTNEASFIIPKKSAELFGMIETWELIRV